MQVGDNIGVGVAAMLGRALLVAVALGAGSGSVAQEYCVACSEPNAVYRCVIEGAQPQGGQPLQMLCVTAMAKVGNHAACSVTRGTVFDCDGPVKRVPWAPANASPAAPAGPAQPAAAPSAPPAPSTAGADDPPQTVVEMARRANEQTTEQMKKAGENFSQGAKSMGDAVGNATKKTWDCMTSLFTRC